jgi:hypothetical protein
VANPLRSRLLITLYGGIATTRWLVTLRLRERFAFRFGSNHVANLSQRLNARRERVPIIIDDPAKLRFECGGLFVGKFKGS